MAQRSSRASYVIWGCVAICAVLASAFTIAVVVGAHRGISIAGLPKRSAPPTPAAIERPIETVAAVPAVPSQPKPDTTALEIARLNDALRLLAAERDSLAARLEQVERTLSDITASIKEQPASRAEPAPPPVRVAAAPSQPTPPPEVIQAPRPAPAREIGEPMNIFQPYSSVQPLINTPSPAKAPMQIQAVVRNQEPASARAETAPARLESTASRTEFAVDLGGDATMDGLRALWANLQGNHGQTLSGLRPLVSVQEGKQRGSVELRLVAGPMANAAAAARTCAALQAKGVGCQTTVFDGQRLALR
ncbi:MAG: hypothetical protein IT539_14635 [Bradyrhizobiaceae bacterium]|nr:hypothetical protein [Bradyrhizobiaceae bacterium]